MRFPRLVCAAAFTLACGVQAQSTPVDTYPAYLMATSQLQCEAKLRCCGTICDKDSDASFYQSYARTLDYLTQGLLGYDKAAAQDCTAGLIQHYASCDAAIFASPIPASCGKVLTPLSPVGGLCETGVASCVPGTTCVMGTCVALLKLGQPCQLAQPGLPSQYNCVSGSFCNTSKNPFVCTATVPTGQPCPAGAGCDASSYCNVAQPPFVCTPYGQRGQACSTNSPCDATANLLCLPPGTCAPTPVPQTVREQLCDLH